jgi:hypothetical protein
VLESVLPPDGREHLQNLAMKNLHSTRVLLKGLVHVLQRLSYEREVLQRCIRLLPEIGLHDIHHPDGAAR